MFDKRLMRICPESKKYIAGNILLQWLELAMNAVMIALIARICEGLLMWPSVLRLWPSLIVIALSIGLRFFTQKGAVKMSYMASRTVKRVMRERIYGKLLKLGLSYREHAATAELVQESVEGVEQLESYFGQYVPQFFYAFIAPLTLFFLFGFSGSWRVAAVLLVCVPLIPVSIMLVQRLAKNLLSRYWGQYTKLGSSFLENLQGMTTLKTYQADGYKNEEMNRESENFREVTMKVLTMQLNSIIVMDFVAYGGAAVGIIFAIEAFINGSVTLGSSIFMILLSAEFFLPMRRLGSFFHIAMNGMAASDKIFRFLSEEEPAEKEALIPEGWGDMKLSGVHFSYTPDREVLHGVSMQFPKGSFTGIAGESGSGKSTVAALLMGKSSAIEGEISIAGLPIESVREESLMKNISYIGLGSVFFKGSVRKNLLIAGRHASDEDLWRLLERCGIADFFRAEQGLDTVLIENASNLSGGQKQRLALARALLHDTPAYIFDEATSNIDIESEELILAEIKALAKSRTVIMISHRLANLTDADNIYCMEKGSVAGSGTHAELLDSCGVYSRLWKTQQALELFGKEALI